jgi:hypothetical protein
MRAKHLLLVLTLLLVGLFALTFAASAQSEASGDLAVAGTLGGSAVTMLSDLRLEQPPTWVACASGVGRAKCQLKFERLIRNLCRRGKLPERICRNLKY